MVYLVVICLLLPNNLVLLSNEYNIYLLTSITEVLDQIYA